MNKTTTIAGREVFFKRRRYGKRVFTWAHILISKYESVCVGDPWPCVTPPTAELTAAVKAVHLPAITFDLSKAA